jgi:Tol biopolymer transport system component
MRALFLLLIGSVLAGCGGGSGGAPTSPVLGAAAPLSADTLVFDSSRTGNHEIFLMKTDGSGARQLTSDTNYENWWPRISPDRRKLLFYRSPRGLPERYDLASLWAMNADGTAVTLLRAKGTDGWALQGHAEWSPDGQSIAMFGGGTSPQIFIADVMGRSPRQVTDRPGVNTDVSWSPDGKTLLFNGCAATPCSEAGYEIYSIPAAGGSAVRITSDSLPDYDPYFSPDGKTIAWLVKSNPAGWNGLGAWGIRLANADGTNARWLINDGQINSKPAWSLDGQSIFFHRMEPLKEPRWGVFRINVDGSALTPLTANAPGNNEHPSN